MYKKYIYIYTHIQTWVTGPPAPTWVSAMQLFLPAMSHQSMALWPRAPCGWVWYRLLFKKLWDIPQLIIILILCHFEIP